MIPPAVIQDRRLKRRDLIVYGLALEQLSFVSPKPFKVRTIGKAVGMHFQHAAASVRRLTALGYLERGPNYGRGCTYLLRIAPIAQPHVV